MVSQHGIFSTQTGEPRKLSSRLSSKAAIADAKENVPDAFVIHSDMAKWQPRKMSAVVADPSRTGLGKPGVNVIVQTKAPVIALVSCDAASLGRDARLLTEAGYRFEHATMIDMFPHTSHVEVVSRFVLAPKTSQPFLDVSSELAPAP